MPNLNELPLALLKIFQNPTSQNVPASWIGINPGLSPVTQKDLLTFRQQALKLHPFPDHNIWLLTSGTTGTPKWIGLKHTHVLATAQAFVQHFGLTDEDSWCLSLPPFHLAGVSVCARAISQKTNLISLPKWSVDNFNSALTTTPFRCCSLVSSQVFDIVQAKMTAPCNFKLLLAGGSAISPPLFAKAQALGWPIVESYACTEAGGTVAVRKAQETCFLTLPHIETSVTTEGTLLLKSSHIDMVILEPKKDPLLTQNIYQTADCALIKPHQPQKVIRFELLGRKNDLLKIQAEWVNLASLQAHWQTFWKPHDVISSLVAIPDEKRGSCLTALGFDLQKRPDADDLFTRLIKAFNLTVMPFEHIQKWLIGPEVQDIYQQAWGTSFFQQDPHALLLKPPLAALTAWATLQMKPQSNSLANFAQPATATKI
jgi:acyl-coenzyme A synthetase/AMP-(fatty) acid ligase